MKKIGIICVLSIFIFILGNIIYIKTIGYRNISSNIGINLPLFIDIDYNSVYRFHGDGEIYAKVFFSDRQSEKFMKKISRNSNWSKLPMDDYLQNLISNNNYTNFSVPYVEKGYYIFVDRNNDKNHKYILTKEFTSNSYNNFAVAIFVPSRDLLYYYQVDI